MCHLLLDWKNFSVFNFVFYYYIFNIIIENSFKYKSNT